MPDVAKATADLEASCASFLRILRDDTAVGIRDALLQLRRDMLAAGRVKVDPRFKPTYANDAYLKDAQAARAKCQAQLDKVETYMGQAVDSVRARIARSTTEQRDASAELAYQLQRQGVARRIDMLRAVGVDAAEIIRHLAASGDMLGLDVIREDLPFTASDSQEDQTRLESLQAQLDMATTPLLSAAQQAGRVLEKELATGVYRMKVGFSQARNEATGAASGLAVSYPVSSIPAWRDGEMVPVAFTDTTGGAPASAVSAAPGDTGYTAQPFTHIQPNPSKPYNQ
jgi:hypothetical protein